MVVVAAVVLPDLKPSDEERARPGRPWRVILYNDDVHLFEDVVLWVQKATGCALHVAEQITLTAHNTGRAVCYEGEKEECQRVAGSLRNHGLQVEVDEGGC